mmetsp:Transcript_27738/g.51630  ORF Transcript_27738/g.51630 Transcript_27738/m.51630 type:complete len:113 (+) Transcript_27738:289-627(+)
MSQPIDKVQQFPVEASFFENENENGKWINATVSKVYERDGAWHRTSNFNNSDLLKLNALMPRIMAKMHELELGPRHIQHQTDGLNLGDVKQEAQTHKNAKSQGQPQDQGQNP